jgi:putative ABC transport system permease protein
MHVEDQIWNLVIKKLTDEASEQELHELNELLKQNPDINNTAKLMFSWWQPDEQEETEDHSYALFKKVLNRIKDAENTLKPALNTDNQESTKPYQSKHKFKKK